MIQVFKTIYENRHTSLTLLSVLKKAFNENDEIKLIKLRCETLRELEAIEEELDLATSAETIAIYGGDERRN